MAILFLDFDGVLHPDPCVREQQHFENLHLLENLLRDFPMVEIVVSSTWRRKRTLGQLQTFFSEDIAKRIIGVTPHHADFPELAETVGPTYQREIEVKAWMRTSAEPWRPWVALDDKAYWFRPFCPELVLCDPKIGLDRHVALKLREKLTVR